MKRAVIIGDNAFPNAPGNNLIGCVPDAEHVTDFLEKNFGLEATLLFNATKGQEWAALTAMCQAAQPGDYLFYSHSSHGGLQDDGTPFLACSDIRELGSGWDPATVITHEELHNLIMGLPQGVIFEALIDACHSANLEKDLGKSYGRSKFITHSQGGPTEAKVLLPQPPNGILWSACGMSETAADGGSTGGVFTTAWLAAWKAGLSRHDQINEVKRLIQAGGYQQHPAVQTSWELALKPFGIF